MQPVDPETFLVTHLPVVDTVVSEIARRQRVCGDELAEFRSLAYLKLVDRDYETLRQFRGGSSLRTYLTIVLHRVLLDHRNRQWGRWRPSVSARRHGALAVRIERLVTRDGLSVDEAIASIGRGADVSSCADFVRALKPRRPVTCDRATAGQDAVPECVDPAAGPDARVREGDLREQAYRVQQLVEDALHELDSQDHLILTLRFRDEMSVSDIARVLGLDAKPLYRRIENLLDRLHRMLSTDASCPQDIGELAGELWADYLPASESRWWRPSNEISDNQSAADDRAVRNTLPRRRAPGGVHRQIGVAAMPGD
jgi:RNA polymerase sigma factor (sigma-70 family)